MTLVIENGSLVSGANSYVSTATAQSYLTDRGILTQLNEGVLIRAADFINSYRLRFKGTKRTAVESSMQFPREGVTIDQQDLPNDVIPQVIKDAQIETAMEYASGTVDIEDTRPVKKEKLGSLEVEYDTAVTYTPATFADRITAMLRPVLNNNYGRVSR